MMRAKRNRPWLLVVSISIASSIALYVGSAWSHDPLPRWQGELPSANFDHLPKRAFESSDYIIKLDQLGHFYRVPGEFGYRMWGENYGFEALSLIITDTHPGGGPGLHTHDVEEAHVLLEGSAKYQIGDQTLTVQAPYVAKVPAGVPHTFINTGTEPMNIIAVFPSKRPSVKVIGPNPLISPRPTR